MESQSDRPGGSVLSPSFVLGLDLGQTTDYTALIAGELVPSMPLQVLIRHMQRLPKQMPYPAQVAVVSEIVMRIKEMGRVVLVIDQTGVGRAVVDLFKAARLGVTIWPVTIAGSQMGAARRDATTGDWVAPKKDLVGAAVSLMHSGQMKIASGLPAEMVRIFKEEMANFSMKISAAGNVGFEAWREGIHDDLVLAAGMVAWAAQRWARPGGLV